MKNTFILLLFVTSLNLHAQKFLVNDDEEDAHSLGNTPEQSILSSSQDSDREVLNFKKATKFLQLIPIIGVRNYNLTSSNNMKIDFSGIEYGLALSYTQKYSEVNSWALEMGRTNYSYKDLGANVSPNEMTGESTNIKLTHESRIWSSSFIDTYIQFSYLFNQDKNDTTTPIQITDQKYHSIGVGLSFEKNFSNQRTLSITTSFHPTFKYTESPLSSGILEKSNLYQWSFQYNLPLTAKWYLSLGHRGSIQSLEFSGASERSLPSANITNTRFSGTIGVAYAL